MTVNNLIYSKSLKGLNKLTSSKDIKERLWVQKYCGSNKQTNCIKSGEVKKLAKKIVGENNLDRNQLTKLLDSLYSNARFMEETTLAARILEIAPKLRQQIDPNKLDYWLNFTHGWAETDVLCQSSFTSDELLSNWSTWKKLLIKFSKDKNVHKRRASLVLLTKPTRMSNDKRLSDLAFKNVDLLKEEKDILITKAVSWILRSLIKYHKEEVANYLKENEDELPRIAVREVTNKLLTGVKSKKK